MHLHWHLCGGCVWYDAHSLGRAEWVKVGRVWVVSEEGSGMSILEREQRLYQKYWKNKNAASSLTSTVFSMRMTEKYVIWGFGEFRDWDHALFVNESPRLNEPTQNQYKV